MVRDKPVPSGVQVFPSFWVVSVVPVSDSILENDLVHRNDPGFVRPSTYVVGKHLLKEKKRKSILLLKTYKEHMHALPESRAWTQLWEGGARASAPSTPQQMHLLVSPFFRTSVTGSLG